MVGEAYWPLLVQGDQIQWADLQLLEKEPSFHAASCRR